MLAEYRSENRRDGEISDSRMRSSFFSLALPSPVRTVSLLKRPIGVLIASDPCSIPGGVIFPTFAINSEKG